MNSTTLNQLSQGVANLQVACQEQCSLDTETEAVFHDLAAELDSHCQHCACQQDDQMLYLTFLRYFVRIRTFLDSQLSANELERKAENLLGMLLDCQDFEKIAQYFV